MVVKTIVVRNLFSFEYDGSNPSLPTKRSSCKATLFLSNFYERRNFINFDTNKDKGKTYKTIIETNIDEVFIVTKDLEIYILPIKELKNKSTINLCDKYQKYKVK